MSAFKILQGVAIRKDRGEKPFAMEIELIESAPGVLKLESGGFGVRIPDGPLAGTVILVSKAWLESIAHQGHSADNLET